MQVSIAYSPPLWGVELMEWQSYLPESEADFIVGPYHCECSERGLQVLIYPV